MKSKRIIKVKAVRDEEFVNSFWGFDILNELTIAFQQFQRQFNGVEFQLTGLEKWNSMGPSELVLFPENVIRSLQRKNAEDEVVEGLITEIIEMGLPIENPQGVKMRFLEALKEARKEPETWANYFLGYLRGWLEAHLEDSLYEDLKAKFAISKEEDIIIGFTGKILSLREQRRLGSASLGSLFNNDAYILIGAWIGRLEPSNVILHEIGHLFGTGDIKDNPTFLSVMTISPDNPTYDFDEKNKQIILDKITKIF